MIPRTICNGPVAITTILLLMVMTVASLLTSCSTAPTSSAGNAGFKFWVMRYKPPVDATSWVPDTGLSADPEGAALNIAAAMQQGNMGQWLSNWEPSECPHLTPAQSETLLNSWRSLQRGHVYILGRVVAEANVIIELSMGESPENSERIQIPLKRSKDRWWLAAMDPASEYLHWENSPNKIINYIDPDAFLKHMDMLRGSKSVSESGSQSVKIQFLLAGSEALKDRKN
jgi:hypothetical protein